MKIFNIFRENDDLNTILKIFDIYKIFENENNFLYS
jgi:hypothetical protein